MTAGKINTQEKLSNKHSSIVINSDESESRHQQLRLASMNETHPNSSVCKSRTKKTYKRLSLFGNFKDSCPLKSHFLQSLCLSGKNVYQLRLLLELSEKSRYNKSCNVTRKKRK